MLIYNKLGLNLSLQEWEADWGFSHQWIVFSISPLWNELTLNMEIKQRLLDWKEILEAP